LLAQFINLTGIAAFVLGTFGSLLLAVKRATVSGLKIYSSPVDYFNLFFLFAIFATGLFSWIINPSLSDSRMFINGVITFKPVSVPLITALNFILFELFLIYMPFTNCFII